LVDEVRHDLTLRYLAQPGQTLTRVAELVGYGQLSSFTRWFISQFQETPSEWRRRMRQGRPAAGKQVEAHSSAPASLRR
jgi:AraC-like DNA-binding protein